MNPLSFQFISTVRLGVKSLMLHKLRSILTMLGIIFGVCSVIAMLAIGEGASYEAQEAIKKLGSQNIILRSVKPPDDAKQSGMGRELGARVRPDLRRRRAHPVHHSRGGPGPAGAHHPRECPLRAQQRCLPDHRHPAVLHGDRRPGHGARPLPDARPTSCNHDNVCVLTVGPGPAALSLPGPARSVRSRSNAFYYRVVGLVREKNMPEQRTQAGKMEGEPLDNNVYIPLSTAALPLRRGAHPPHRRQHRDREGRTAPD